jgi:hypothetical protein
MLKQNIIQTLLFIIFFSIGASVLGGSVLCDDLLQYYMNRQLLKAAKESLRRLESLNTDYDVLLQRLQEDPNLVRRLAPATLGTEPEDKSTVYPKASAEQLAAVRKVLMEGLDRETAEQAVPDWIIRCCKPVQRTVLFFAGAFLILISFICFGPAEQPSQKT